MVTSWNWLLLADFASFKPTFLPEDNPADFSYFFDTSRRRTCYLAPERFVESSWRNTDVQTQAGNIDLTADLTTNEIKRGDVTPAMDIFSAGWVCCSVWEKGGIKAELEFQAGSVWDMSLTLAHEPEGEEEVEIESD